MLHARIKQLRNSTTVSMFGLALSVYGRWYQHLRFTDQIFKQWIVIELGTVPELDQFCDVPW